MKVSNVNSNDYNTKPPFGGFKGFAALKRIPALVKDIFQKSGKEKLPNCIWGADDYVGTKVGQIIFSPEDLAKMAEMPIKERIKYQNKLITAGKYFIETPPK